MFPSMLFASQRNRYHHYHHLCCRSTLLSSPLKECPFKVHQLPTTDPAEQAWSVYDDVWEGPTARGDRPARTLYRWGMHLAESAHVRNSVGVCWSHAKARPRGRSQLGGSRRRGINGTPSRESGRAYRADRASNRGGILVFAKVGKAVSLHRCAGTWRVTIWPARPWKGLRGTSVLFAAACTVPSTSSTAGVTLPRRRGQPHSVERIFFDLLRTEAMRRLRRSYRC